jgi:hypothetical protein
MVLKQAHRSRNSHPLRWPGCRRLRRRNRGIHSRRRGVAALDYVLVLGVILPLAVFLYRVVPRIIHLVYDMVTVLTVWPFP